MTMICVSSICCFVRFQYDLKYASSEKPWFPRHVPFQIHDTRKQWQWSVFRQSVVLSGFNMIWNTPHLRNLHFQDMSLFRSMTLENNDNDLCFVNMLFCQVSIWFEIRLIWSLAFPSDAHKAPQSGCYSQRRESTSHL